MIAGGPSRQSSQGRKRYHGAKLALVAAQFAADGARQREIADRHHVRAGVAGLGMPAAIAERVELLDIAEPQARLFLDPGAQADLESAVARRIERAERQAGQSVAPSRAVRISGS